jgi:hypothetical protein
MGVAGAAPCDHHGGAEEEEGPAGEDEGLEEFPEVNVAGPDGKGEEEGGLAIFEEAGVADDGIRENEHREEETEDEIEEALGKEAADEGKPVQEEQAAVEEVIADSEVAETEAAQDGEHEAGFFAEIGDACPERDEASPEEEAEEAEGHGGELMIANLGLLIFGFAPEGGQFPR